MEILTGKDANATTLVVIHSTPYNIELISRETFKSGLPYKISAYVKYYDRKQMVIDEINSVKFKITYHYDDIPENNREDCEHLWKNKEMTTFEAYIVEGVADKDIEIPLTANKIDILVSSTKLLNKIKKLLLSFNFRFRI